MNVLRRPTTGLLARRRWGVDMYMGVRWKSKKRRPLDQTPPPPVVSWHSNTPLASQLRAAIETTGPISLASYMRQCLTSSSQGYYTTSRDPFGVAGDFVTSPELSQMFGECIAIWLVAEWMGQGRPAAGVQLVELGPGRGTLMEDVLRSLDSFRQLMDVVEGMFLVEASPVLREVQKERLCGKGAAMEEVPVGDSVGWKAKTKNGLDVIWVEDFKFVPAAGKEEEGEEVKKTPFVLAHEFFDALPIHAFEATKNGWRELLVAHYRQEVEARNVDTTATPPPKDITNEPTTTPAPNTTTPPPTQVEPLPPLKKTFASEETPIFGLARAKSATPHSLFLPTLSERYTSLASTPGSIIEISPSSLSTMTTIASRIGRSRTGAALIIDYGPASTVPINSLRGIRSHSIVSPFHAPGATDVSADVDFGALVETALAASEGVEVHGPAEQGAFLKGLGMAERMRHLLANEADGERKEMVETAYNRMTGSVGGGMGRVYKALAVVPERGGRAPVGFGGRVELE